MHEGRIRAAGCGGAGKGKAHGSTTGLPLPDGSRGQEARWYLTGLFACRDAEEDCEGQRLEAHDDSSHLDRAPVPRYGVFGHQRVARFEAEGVEPADQGCEQAEEEDVDERKTEAAHGARGRRSIDKRDRVPKNAGDEQVVQMPNPRHLYQSVPPQAEDKDEHGYLNDDTRNADCSCSRSPVLRRGERSREDLSAPLLLALLQQVVAALVVISLDHV